MVWKMESKGQLHQREDVLGAGCRTRALAGSHADLVKVYLDIVEERR